MNKIRLAAAISAGLLLCGCSRSTGAFEPGESGIYVAGDGAISSVIVENYEGEEDEAGLRGYLEEAVIAHNVKKGAPGQAGNGESEKLPVALASCKMKGGRIEVIFDYATGEDLADFAWEQQDESSQVESLSVGTVADGLVSGRIANMTFVKAKDNTAVGTDAVASDSGQTMVTVDGSVTLQTGGKVTYMSQGVTRVNDHTVKTPEGGSCIIFK